MLVVSVQAQTRGSVPNVAAWRAAAGAPTERDERRLVREAQAGSEEALEALFRAHWYSAYRAAWLIARDVGAAEDIAQEAFVAAARALQRFDRRRPFSPWLHRIVANRAIDFARARALRRETGAEQAEQLPAPPDAPSHPFSEALVSALGELAPDQRAVVVLRYLFEYTPGEVASALSLPRGTVNSRLRRALDRLAEVMEEER